MTPVKALSICSFLILRPIAHCCCCCSVTNVSNSFETQPHGLRQTRLPCPLLLSKILLIINFCENRRESVFIYVFDLKLRLCSCLLGKFLPSEKIFFGPQFFKYLSSVHFILLNRKCNTNVRLLVNFYFYCLKIFSWASSHLDLVICILPLL